MVNNMVRITSLVNGVTERFKKRIEDNMESAKSNTLDLMLQDIDPFVAYKSGELSNSASKLPNNSGIQFNKEYASFAFSPSTKTGIPKQYTKSKHPSAVSEPIDVAVLKYDEKWAEFFREELLK